MLFILIVNCENKSESRSAKQQTAADSTDQAGYVDSIVIGLVGIDSVSVLDLLEKSYDVKSKSTAMGTFVQAIDSVENSEGVFWMYSVNDSMVQVACDKYITKNGDQVKWHYRKFLK
jgi:hypothetical protein